MSDGDSEFAPNKALLALLALRPLSVALGRLKGRWPWHPPRRRG